MNAACKERIGFLTNGCVIKAPMMNHGTNSF